MFPTLDAFFLHSDSLFFTCATPPFFGDFFNTGYPYRYGLFTSSAFVLFGESDMLASLLRGFSTFVEIS